MKNQGLFTSLAAATILLGGVLPAALGRSAVNTAPAAAELSQAASSATASSSGADSEDALDTIAESLGVSVTAEGLKGTIGQDIELLRRADDVALSTPEAAVARKRRQSAVNRLVAFFGLPIREDAPGLADARAAVAELSRSLNSKTPPPPAAAGRLGRFVAEVLQRRCVEGCQSGTPGQVARHGLRCDRQKRAETCRGTAGRRGAADHGPFHDRDVA